MIRFEHVTKVYESTGNGPDITALHDVNLHIRKGEFVFVLGHSGAGKSTFLKLILREEVATEGRVLVNKNDLSTIRQRDIPYLRRGLGVVFQDFRLLAFVSGFFLCFLNFVHTAEVLVIARVAGEIAAVQIIYYINYGV